jgi:DNA-binding response OmpR family regulator
MDTVTLTLAKLEELQTKASIRVGASHVDPRNGAAQTPQGKRRLRRKELDLLMFLHQHAGAIFSRDELLRHVWNYRGQAMTRTVDQTVATLRRKLNENAACPKHLITVYGLGYRLQPDHAALGPEATDPPPP